MWARQRPVQRPPRLRIRLTCRCAQVLWLTEHMGEDVLVCPMIFPANRDEYEAHAAKRDMPSGAGLVKRLKWLRRKVRQL